MKKEIFFVCEKCGTKFQEAEKAEKCETSHKKIKRIISAEYKSLGHDSSGLPSIISVEFKNPEKENVAIVAKYKRV